MSRRYGSNRASVTDSPAFRRWFGDSVVVDENGEPLVVYHGTDDDDFKSFRAEALPRGGRKGRLLGEGFYFTSDPDQAARWGRRVIAAYLRIENPRTQRGGLLVPASSDQDGTIAAGAPGTRDGEMWFVVKSPYQIKSATDNDGSFDPDDDHFTSNPDPASPLENPAFRRWFGDSVVVDEDGEPLVLYHGTDKSFDVFKTRSKSVNSTTFGPVDTERSGIFVSDNPEFSREFGRRLLPLYARIENPAEIDRDTVLNFAETIDPFGSERDLWIRVRHVSRPWGLFEGELGPRFIAYLQELGHDGATFIEDVPKGDDVGEDEQEYVEGRTYVVFDPRQIKSATDNDGSFDPDDDHFTSNGRTFVPPQKVADEAAYGLYLRSQMPKSNRCCTAVGLARAKQLKNREPVSVTTLERMRSYFERHEVDKRGAGWGVDSKGYQAWLLWGGDSGRAWANKMLREVGRARANAAGDAVFRQDIPNARWVADKLEEAEEGGRNRWGVPRRMGPITGSFSRPLRLPTELLATLRGERGEQDDPRPESLKYIADHWERLKDEAVFIEVDPFGQPWVSEGNHRIMVASALGEPSVLAEVRYFSGGQLKAKAKWKPKQLLEYDANADAREDE